MKLKIKQVLSSGVVFDPPKKIKILSDDNEIELVRGEQKSSVYFYKYIKSKTKLGKEVSFTEEVLRKYLKHTFKEIK